MTAGGVQRWAGFGLAATALAGVTLAISHQAGAQRAAPSAEPRLAAQQPPPGQPGPGGVPGRPGPGGGFGAGGGFGGFGGGAGFPGFRGFGGEGAITATSSAVYVLRGNRLYAFDARTLRLIAQAELPEPEMSPGFAPGAPGRSGRPGGAPGARTPGGAPQPGGAGGQPPTGAPAPPRAPQPGSGPNR